MAEHVQTFDSGATRNAPGDKFDYEAFLNPEVLHEYGKFMHAHRKQRDGTLRDGDNWQKGIPFAAYIKSLVRHTFDLWRMHRGLTVINPDTNEPHTKEELCCAIMFNAMGYLKELVDPAGMNKYKSPTVTGLGSGVAPGAIMREDMAAMVRKTDVEFSGDLNTAKGGMKL